MSITKRKGKYGKWKLFKNLSLSNIDKQLNNRRNVNKISRQLGNS